jgi:predicted NUDIX family NTP pyrophosphohydrolase
MPVVSAGLLLYRRPTDEAAGLEVLLVHPGGPYWAKKDAGAWSIPKGNVEPGEDALQAACREFLEETGHDIGDVAAWSSRSATTVAPDETRFLPLGGVKYRNHKIVRAWAVEGDCDADAVRSITFEMEWPPRSGRIMAFPEIDRAAWFDLRAAREAVLKAQRRFIDDLEALLGGRPPRRSVRR